MGALPRPTTPGPWETYSEDSEFDVVTAERVGIASYIGSKDAAAIAALPERIAREDRVREYCARVIARSTMPRGHMQDVDFGAMHGMADMAQEVLRILDGEEGA